MYTWGKHKLGVTANNMLCQTVFVVFLLCLGSAWSKERNCGSDGIYRKSHPFHLFPLPDCPSEIGGIFRLYIKKDRHQPYALDRTYIPSVFNGRKPTVFIVHGFRSNYTEDWVKGMKNALLKNADLNVVLVGWAKGASYLTDYKRSASNTRTAGFELAQVINNLKKKGGLSEINIHCIGHSLGAHLCGHAGKLTKIGRISGLDPAGPNFDKSPLEAGLNKNSALFVDVIHTNGKGPWPVNVKGDLYPYGTMIKRGHMDFYPNGANIQPGCVRRKVLAQSRDGGDTVEPHGDLVACSHSRVQQLYTESITRNCYTAYSKCTDNFNIPATCSPCSSCPKMGYWVKNTSSNHGVYYLKTTSGPSSFCLPKNGILEEENKQ